MTPEFVRQNFSVRQLHRHLVWRFHPKDARSRRVWHYRLVYLVAPRKFIATIVERRAGKQPRRIAVGDDVCEALRHALPPKAAALCIRKSILLPKGSDT